MADGWPRFDLRSIALGNVEEASLAAVASGFGYGDAPRHDTAAGRCAGETMACDVARIVEAWERKGGDWERRPELEG